jgi:hypothetical protein
MPQQAATTPIQQAVSRKLVEASYSKLNWEAETRRLILSELRQTVWGKFVRPSEFPREPSAIQLDLYTDRLFPALQPGTGLDTELPASLIISVHPNGSICFLASGFSSSSSTLTSKSFTLGYYTHANKLAGTVGRSRIRRHIHEFEQLACFSLTEFRPTRASGRFISRLESRTHKLRPIYETVSEARRAEVTQNVALAGGLAAGLVSSTIFPTMLAFGSKARNKADEILSVCREAASIERCLSSRNHAMHDLAGQAVVPETVLLLV